MNSILKAIQDTLSGLGTSVSQGAGRVKEAAQNDPAQFFYGTGLRRMTDQIDNPALSAVMTPVNKAFTAIDPEMMGINAAKERELMASLTPDERTQYQQQKTMELTQRVSMMMGGMQDVSGGNWAALAPKPSIPMNPRGILNDTITSRPAHQTLLPQAVDAKDWKRVAEILDSIPEGDPYKKTMESLLAPTLKKNLPSMSYPPPQQRTVGGSANFEDPLINAQVENLKMLRTLEGGAPLAPGESAQNWYQNFRDIMKIRGG